ncbi:hypothetical protein BDR22DRAFT_975693 [Usnea florida]
MDASPAHPHQMTSTYAIFINEKTSSTSVKQAQNSWVEGNTERLLRAIGNWKKAPLGVSMCSRAVTRYSAIEGTEKDLRYTLHLIYKQHGPLDLHYRGCDTLAQHWVSGWDKSTRSTSAQRIHMCVDMGKRLPGQSPALDKLEAMIQNDSDEEEEIREHAKDKEEDEEKDEEGNEDQGGEDGEEKDMEMADWVNVSSGGVDDGDWMMPNEIPSKAKDAGRLFLDAFRKF